ncbi:MAG TPA: L-threonine 3-dehydrogenase [bacterium (Candidatus Stahlbacteria)]|nr:L-threonine 3-dehydrogenase [Candidatus Stahlbacteria bacterium]
MADKMKAIVKTKRAPGAEMTLVDIPKIKPNEVLVKVKATSICGTDVHIYEWNEWAQGRIKTPQILRHELAGEVVDVGSQVKSVKVGDYISAETHIPCGRCFQCKTGLMHICSNMQILGVDRDGCFATHIAIPEIVVWKNDPSIPPEFASVQEPLGNATYAVLVEDVAGKTIAIFGDGPTGLFATGVARVSGASTIFLVGRHAFRMNIAKKMGADILLNDKKDDIVGFIMDATNGGGVDIVLDMAGTQQAIDKGFKILRRGGRFTAFGIPAEPLKVDLADGVIFKGATIYGITGREMFSTWFKVANFLKSKRLDISPVITHKLPLDEFEKGFSLMMTRPKVSGKVVFFP